MVIILPSELWPPIQNIRQKYDRQFRRWMPHITMIYPFRPRKDFESFLPSFSKALRQIQPLTIHLNRFDYFQHGRQKYTLWLAPEPVDKIAQLQDALQTVVPDCNEVRKHKSGFTPHLSVGQVSGPKNLQQVRSSLESTWKPLSFTLNKVCLISRSDPPDDVFQVVHKVSMGS